MVAAEAGADGGDPLSKGEQTRRAVLDAAIRRFGADGFRATSVADIAREAGVGGTVPYTYFDNKEALFFAALDQDASGVIEEALPPVLEGPADLAWTPELFVTLVGAIENHPLARRILAGLEPHATHRLIEIPALAELREAVGRRLGEDQKAGVVRADIDTTAIGNGIVSLWLAMLTTVLQYGIEGIQAYGDDVLAVFKAAVADDPD